MPRLFSHYWLEFQGVDGIFFSMSHTARLRRQLYFYYPFLALCLIGMGLTLTDEALIRRWFLEGGLIECIQLANLVAALVLVGAATVLSFMHLLPERWGLLVMVWGFCWAVNREMDGLWIDYFERKDIYHIFMWLFGALGVATLGYRFSEIWSVFLQQMRAQYFKLFYVGAGGYVFSQIVASIFFNLGASRQLKRIGEESMELIFGTFFVFAALEAWCLIRDRSRATVLAESQPSWPLGARSR